MTHESLDRRKHKRYAASDYSMALFAKAVGLVSDISEVGMALNIIDYQESLSSEKEITFHCKMPDTIITGLPVKVVREEAMKFSRFGGFITQKIGIRFDNPGDLHQEQIRQHISGLPKTATS